MRASFVHFHRVTSSSSSSLQQICKVPRPVPQTLKRRRLQPTMALHVLWQTALSTALYQATFFTITYVKKFDTLTDFAGTTNFILIALQTFLQAPENIRSKIVTAFVILWATRLGGFLFYRIVQWGHDKRFDKTRNSFTRLAIFWNFQALWVWIVSLPITLLNGAPHPAELGFVDYVGWALFALGCVVEAVADAQKLRHKAVSDKWLDTGLWRYSRHPNYFGEIVVWFGVYLSAVSGLRGVQYLAVVSPLFVSWLLLFLSGVPILERSADRKHGDNSSYVEYKQSTSVLVPCPTSMYRRLPESLRRTVFLELKIYDNLGKRKNASERKSE